MQVFCAVGVVVVGKFLLKRKIAKSENVAEAGEQIQATDKE